MNSFVRRTYRVALLATACSVLSPVAVTAAYAAEPPKPPVIEGESEFAAPTGALGATPGPAVLRSAAADPRQPETPYFGPAIDAYADYDGQDECPKPEQPGVLEFTALLNRTYGSHTSYIGRACREDGQSEHKEGRALDYMLEVSNASERAIAESILNWLLATDEHGNKHANARRLGIMYLIWNRQMWRAYDPSAGWQPYSGSNPHTNHIHFSFSWDGALKRTTWWTSARPRPKTAGDFTGDARAEIGVYRKGNGQWHVKNIWTGDQVLASSQYGGDASDIPVIGDLDGDGRSEIGVYRKGNGQWHVKNIRTGEQILASSSYGGDPSDIPVVADFTGDGRAEIGVYRKGNGQWHIKNIRTGEQVLAQHQYGGDPTDIPVVADFTGDGRAEIGVYRKGNGQWHVKNIWTGEQVLASSSYGGDASDIPVTGDFDGDGRAEIGVYRKGNGQWHVKNIRTGEQILASSSYGGDASDIPVVADYTGDGRAEIGVYRKGNGHWHVKNIRTGEQVLAQHQYGGDASDIPIAS